MICLLIAPVPVDCFSITFKVEAELVQMIATSNGILQSEISVLSFALRNASKCQLQKMARGLKFPI